MANLALAFNHKYSSALPYTFCLNNLLFKSDIKFPELLKESNNSKYFYDRQAFTLEAIPESNKHLLQTSFNTVQNKIRNDGTPYCSILENELYYAFNFEEKISFYILKAKPTTCYYNSKNKDVNLLRHFYLDYVSPHIHSLTLSIVLHSSALSYKSEGLIILGESGAGKSTLVSALLSKDFKLLSDDYSLIDENKQITPSYPCIRLWPDSYELFKDKEIRVSTKLKVSECTDKIKLRLNKDNFENNKTLLKKIIILEKSNEQKEGFLIKETNPSNSLIKLISSSYLLDLNKSKKQFKEATKLLNNVQTLTISYKHQKQTTSEVVSKIKDLFSQPT